MSFIIKYQDDLHKLLELLLYFISASIIIDYKEQFLIIKIKGNIECYLYYISP